jgi:hypothetical protein
VAPQCAVENLDKKRVYIPPEVKKDFVESHKIGNYGWIFEIKNPLKEGYVKKRD